MTYVDERMTVTTTAYVRVAPLSGVTVTATGRGVKPIEIDAEAAPEATATAFTTTVACVG